VPETQLKYDPATRRLSLVGGNRKEHDAKKYRPIVLKVIEENPGITTRDFEAVIAERVQRKKGRDALTALVSKGEVHYAKVAYGAKAHYVGCNCDRPRDCVKGEKAQKLREAVKKKQAEKKKPAGK
jgi:hypothetical protein